MQDPIPTSKLTLRHLGPGLLVAATGVGAGDLATASFAGSYLGTGVLWAVIVGALFKFTLNEGLARWQLATGTSFLEGLAKGKGWVIGIIALPYLILWSFFVGSSLISGSGAALHAIIPLFSTPEAGKIVFGILSSALGLALVKLGGFPLFQRIMNVCIGMMFLVVLLTAGALWPGWEAVLTGLFVPSIPKELPESMSWTIALIGGVGGTLTILCHGYWLREEGLDNLEDLPLCRVDLALGYGVTAFFGLGMVIIGSTLPLSGGGESLLIDLGDKLRANLGPIGSWAFLIGALGAIFSSLLGVWQSVPYLFADVYRLFIAPSLNPSGPSLQGEPLSKTIPYRRYQWALAIIPAAGLFIEFKEVQKLYAIIGVAFVPLLALALLILNGRQNALGDSRNGPLAIAGLIATMAFFAWVAGRKLWG